MLEDVKLVAVPSKKSKVVGYPYQLISWCDDLSYVKTFLSGFVKYAAEDKGIIVKAGRYYSIFTTGEGVVKKPEYSPRGVI